MQQARVRIQTAADDEREWIERDLHDGAQQRLVALAIQLDLAAERTGDVEGAAVLRRFATDVEAALAEIRSLASGSSPAALADRGLVEGLRSATSRNALRTTVLAAGIRRCSHEVESAAYFCCLEALQNAAKHARGATAAVVYLSDDGTLHLEVRDDGDGFDQGAVDAGSGFVIGPTPARRRRGCPLGRRRRVSGVLPAGDQLVDDHEVEHDHHKAHMEIGSLHARPRLAGTLTGEARTIVVMPSGGVRRDETCVVRLCEMRT